MQNDGEGIFRNLRWQGVRTRFQRILNFVTASKLELEREKILDDTMILVTTPREHQEG